jgi:hypothetical protein
MERRSFLLVVRIMRWRGRLCFPTTTHMIIIGQQPGITTGDCSCSTSTPKTFMGNYAFQTPVERFSNAMILPTIAGMGSTHTHTTTDDTEHPEFVFHDSPRFHDRIFLSLSKSAGEPVPPPFLDLEDHEQVVVDEQRTRVEEHRALPPRLGLSMKCTTSTMIRSHGAPALTDRRLSLFRPLAQRQQASC